MEREKIVKVSKGDITLVKPNAGQRNDSAVNAMVDGKFNEIKFMVNLVPACVKSHPFGVAKLKEGLNALEPEEYDKLIDAMKEWLVPPVSDVEKK